MRSLFRELDKDGNGVIDREELDAVFAEVGKHFTDAQLQEIMQLADRDQTGTLDYEEFIEFVQSLLSVL